MVHANGNAEQLDGEHGLPLALRSDWTRPEVCVTMPPRSTLLLYTDGLVERRGHSIDEGIATATALIQDGRSQSLDEVADHLMVRLEPAGGYLDDVAMLLYRQPASLSMNFAADLDHLAPSRNALRGWLARAGVEPDQIAYLLTAVGEAVANAIEHGYRDEPGGTVSVHATALVDALHVTVVDGGTWKPPRNDPAANRGRGINLMRGLLEDMTIRSTETGTTVHLYARIA